MIKCIVLLVMIRHEKLLTWHVKRNCAGFVIVCLLYLQQIVDALCPIGDEVDK